VGRAACRVNNAFDRILSGSAAIAARRIADSAAIHVEGPPKPPESRPSRPRLGAARVGPSHFHDVDSREHVDCSRAR